MSQLPASRRQDVRSSSDINNNTQQPRGQPESVAGKSAFNWDVYRDRRTALQHLKQNNTLVDTIIETEDGRAHELVHSQVMSAFGDKLTAFIKDNGVGLPSLSNHDPNNLATSQHMRPTLSSSSSSHQQISSQQQQQQQQLANDSQHVELSHLAAHHKNANRLKLVRLPRVNRYTLGILVECAYSGYIRTDLTSGGIWQVLEMADYYEMADVIRACCAFLTKNLNQANCIYFYHIGIRHRHPLQRCAWQHIRSHFKHILAHNLNVAAAAAAGSGAGAGASHPTPMEQQTIEAPVDNLMPSRELMAAAERIPEHMLQNLPVSNRAREIVVGSSSRRLAGMNWYEFEYKFNSLATIKYEHFEPLLLHDKLNVDNEESIWQAIRFWCHFDLAERAQQVASLLPCMRFPRFRHGTEFSARHIWRDPLIVNNERAQHQLAVLDRNHRDFLACTSSGAGRAQSSGGGSQFKPFRDGFNLPCAPQPRQLRPRIPHSILLAIGGWQQGQPTTLIESYDLNCNMWFESKRRIRSPLAYHGIEYINGLLYICGGTDGNDILSELFTFDPIRGECAQKPPMRDSRCYVSTAQLGNYLYALGGHNGAQRMRSVERFELAREQWAHVSNMNVARSDASACAYEGRIYIAGGLNDQVIESSVEFYNPQDDTWTFISSMLMPRTSFTLLAVGARLLAIGGNNGTERLASVEQYDFASKLWSQHSQMRHKRSTFSAALVDETKLIVVGGYNGQTPFALVEMYDEPTRQWISMQKIRYDRSGLRAVVVKDLANSSDYTFLGSPQAAVAAASAATATGQKFNASSSVSSSLDSHSNS